MNANYDIQAGVCEFRTRGTAVSEGSQHVMFCVERNLEAPNG